MDSIEISVTPQFDGFVFSLRPSIQQALLKEFPQLSPIHAILVSYVENKRDILLDNLFIATSDNEKSINRKILILNSIRETLLKHTDIDALSSDIQELNFIRLMSKINAQIEAFEIITGKKDLESLKRAGKRFGQKTQFPIGIS